MTRPFRKREALINGIAYVLFWLTVSRILHLQLLLSIMQKYGSEVLQNLEQALYFIKNTLVSGDLELAPLGIALLATLFGNGMDYLGTRILIGG